MGVTWTSLANRPRPREVEVLAFHPQRASTMYAGTWSGLFKSIDGGRTWLRLRFRVGLSYLESVSDLELAQRTPATVYRRGRR